MPAVTGNALGTAGRRAAGTPSKVSGVGPRALVLDTGWLTSGSSYTVPKNATYVEIWAVGGGGGGALGQTSSSTGGGGGGTAISGIAVIPGKLLTFTVGSGGAAGTSSVPNGTSGGPTSVSYDGTTLAAASGGGNGSYNFSFYGANGQPLTYNLEGFQAVSAYAYGGYANMVPSIAGQLIPS